MIPEFSLIIPTYNRFPILRHCLKHLADLRFDKDNFEVILVDDGSTDETKDLKSGTEFGFNLRVLHQPNAGTAAVPRNLGIKNARGLICLFVDDDVMVHPDLLLEHQRLHRTEPNLVVRGPVINFDRLPCPLDGEAYEHERVVTASRDMYGSWTGNNSDLLQHFSMNYLCTSNASLRKYHLEAAGLFDPTFTRWEDAELAVRLKGLGLERRWCFNAVVYHLKPPETLASRELTAVKDGRSAAQLYLRYPSFRMLLRSGLHKFNDLRNALFTKTPLKKLLLRAAASESAGKTAFSKKFAERLLIERAYLDSGLLELSNSKKVSGREKPASENTLK
ncbi:glycosyltransferase family 2 protein [bacterium]|nr:glycosyltransferase family 2 protein [bacterium]